MRERKVRSNLCVSDSNRAGVGVCRWSSATGGFEDETWWRVPKERYLPSSAAGGGGGMRFRSSGGKEKMSGMMGAAVVGWVAGEVVGWAEDSRCDCRRSRFCGVKDL